MPPSLTLLPLLITDGALALVLLWPRARSGPEGHRQQRGNQVMR